VGAGRPGDGPLAVDAHRPAVAVAERAAGLKELAQCVVTVTTPRRTRTMNTTTITSQMLILIQSPPPS
jgi:hypothetical protein